MMLDYLPGNVRGGDNGIAFKHVGMSTADQFNEEAVRYQRIFSARLVSSH